MVFEISLAIQSLFLSLRTLPLFLTIISNFSALFLLRSLCVGPFPDGLLIRINPVYPELVFNRLPEEVVSNGFMRLCHLFDIK